MNRITSNIRSKSRAQGSPWLGFLLLGGIFAWVLMGWWAETHLRKSVEKELSGLSNDLCEKEEEVEDLRGRIVFLENRLLGAELGRQETIEAILELRQRFESQGVEPEVGDPAQTLAEFKRKQDLLRRINRTLRASGAGWLRFLRIGSVVGGELLMADLVLHGPDGFYEGAFLADSCRLTLDRSRSILEVALGKGVRFLGKERVSMPEGHRFELELRDPRHLEEELTGLVFLKGAYPEKKGKKAPHPTLERLRTLSLWKERLESFFALARVEGSRLDLQRIEGLEGMTFLGVELTGYTEGGLLERRIRAAGMEVWTDRDTGRVELRLRDGFIETAGSKIRFPGREYRLILEGWRAREAERHLTGFVHPFHSLPRKEEGR